MAKERGWPEPSYDTVYGVVRRLDSALDQPGPRGPKVYADRFDLLYRREASRPNEMWQADHTPLDLWVLDESAARATWLTIILDDYSRAVAGYRSVCTPPSRCRPRWPCGRRSGARVTRGGSVRHPGDLLYRPRQRLHLPPPRTGRG